MITAFFYVRQRNLKESAKSSSTAAIAKTETAAVAKEQSSPTLSEDLRLGAYMFLVLTVGLGCALYYFDWQDDHTILTVTLHSENQPEPVSYEVYKFQLGERTFTTLDGLVVTVASSERMVVEGLNP